MWRSLRNASIVGRGLDRPHGSSKAGAQTWDSLTGLTAVMSEMPERHLRDFEGVFLLHRQIAHANAPPATFTGKAVWTPKGDGLSYHETGLLEIRGHQPMPSERRYFWAPDLRIYFDDGRFFHQVPASGGSAAHWCDPDQYSATYDFMNWPAFQVVWRVKGPAKDYRMVSQYEKAP